MRRAAILLLIVVVTGACIPAKTKKTAVKPAPARSNANFAAAQKRAYDLGVGHFAEERYAEARKSWQETVRLGPSTIWGQKAGENLRKVDAILSSLNELEKKQ